MEKKYDEVHYRLKAILFPEVEVPEEPKRKPCKGCHREVSAANCAHCSKTMNTEGE